MAVLCIAGNVSARWTRIAGFSDVVNCGFFFNEQRGLIGLDYPSGIYRTYDGGQSWFRSFVPSGYYGTVNDIYMKDSLNGWAITEKLQNDNIFNEQCMWHTSDGGVTWQKAPAVVEMGTSVYETQAGLVLYTKRYGPPIPGLWSSVDKGSSFNSIANDSYTDIDFTDDLHGVASPFNAPALWTSNGGTIWNQSNYNIESWGVYAEKGTPNFVMAGEQNIGTYSKVTGVSRSTNYGMTWNTVGTIPIRSTGHIAGVGKVIYVQSDNLHSYNFQLVMGMYRSTDGGVNWKWVQGPDHYRDSRFCVMGCLGGVVYAFDGMGGVWKTTDGGDGLITEPPKSPSFAPNYANLSVNKCSSLKDTIQLTNLSCEAVTIDSIQFFDSTMEIVQSGALSFGRLPQLPVTLDPAKSEFISIAWDPQLSKAPNPGGTNFIRVWSTAYDGTLHFDTLLTVVVKGVGDAPVPLLKSDSLKLPSVSICAMREDIVSVGNAGCDAMHITDAKINGIAAWEVFDMAGQPLVFPITIDPKSTVDLKIRFSPFGIGTFNAKLDLSLEKDAFIVDTTIALSCRVFRGQTAAATDQVNVGSVPICYTRDTTIWLVNNAECEKLRLDSITLATGDFTMTYDPLPVTLDPGDSFPVRIHYIPRKNQFSQTVLNAYFQATGDSISVRSNIFGFGIPGSSGVLMSGQYGDHRFYDRSKCDLSDSISFKVMNPGCDTLRLLSYTFTTSSPQSIQCRMNRTFPAIFSDAADKLDVTVAAYPTIVGEHTAQLTLHYQLSDYREFDTTYNFRLSVNEGPRLATVSHQAVDFGSSALCDVRDTAIELVNTGCAPVLVKQVSVQGSPQYTFIKVQKTPYTLGPGARDTIIVSYVPTQPGSFSANIRIDFNTDIDSSHVIPLDVDTKDKSYLTMSLVERAQGLYAGDSILFDIVPNMDWADPNLSSLSFQLTYDDDLLTYIHDWPKLPDGALVTEASIVNGKRILLVEVANAAGIELRGGVPLLTVAFQTALADTLMTEMALTQFQLNKDDKFYKSCILASDTRDTSFTLLLRCGETAVRNFMLGKSVFSISQHRPNPLTEVTGYTLKVPVRLEVSASIKATIYDEQGKAVMTKDFPSLPAGTHTLDLDCFMLPSGSYEFIMTSDAAHTSPVGAKFMIVK